MEATATEPVNANGAVCEFDSVDNSALQVVIRCRRRCRMALSRGCRPHFHPPAGLPRREILAGGRGSIPRGGAAADRLFRGLRPPLSSLCQRGSPRVGEQPPPPCATSTALCSYPSTSPA